MTQLTAPTPLTLAEMAFGSLAASSVPRPTQSTAEAQIRALNHRFVSAFTRPDQDFIANLTSNDFLMIGSNGDWIDRTKHIALMSLSPATDSVSYDELSVRLFQNSAIVHGVFEGNASERSPLRVRYTDVYAWTGVAWQLVAAQNTRIRDGVSKSLSVGPPTSSARWHGTDPVGNEDDVLRELNENYVRAFRECDVAWYSAHLSADYVVTSSDGSFGDRSTALANFATPVFATHMIDFPVSDVRIRRFGDIAIINAENAYELKNGRRGVSRYTDIWHKQSDGVWKCISAHITALTMSS